MSPRRDRPIERFGPYHLLERIGQGGMGEVWRARDTGHHDREIALKRLLTGRLAADEEFRRRFRREARATAALKSEHVIPIHDYGEIGGRLFIDMKLVSGGDLAKELERTRRGLPVSEASDLCVQIAHGLDDAHRHGLVHRDIKPSNLLLAADARGRKVYLVDFGIAKVADEAAENDTRTGTTLGTYAYMAPELLRAAKHASKRSDIYALGCVLFEMLTGSKVFPMTGPALIAAHLQEEPPRPSSVRPELAPFDLLLARALAKRPGDRHASAGELAREVKVAAEAHREASRPPGAGSGARAAGGQRAPADTEAPVDDEGRAGGSARPAAGDQEEPGPRDHRPVHSPQPLRTYAVIALASLVAAVVTTLSGPTSSTPPRPVVPPMSTIAAPSTRPPSITSTVATTSARPGTGVIRPQVDLRPLISARLPVR